MFATTTPLDISFVEKKSRKLDETPYALLTGNMFGGPAEFRVLKKNTKKLSDQYASVLVAAETPATFGTADIGDTYVSEIVHLNLTEVNGRAPTTAEFREWAALRGAHSGTDGMVFSMTEIANGARPTGSA